MIIEKLFSNPQREREIIYLLDENLMEELKDFFLILIGQPSNAQNEDAIELIQRFFQQNGL